MLLNAHQPNLGNQAWTNDRIASLRGYNIDAVVLYEDANYGGRSYRIDLRSDRQVANQNESLWPHRRISSIRIERGLGTAR